MSMHLPTEVVCLAGRLVDEAGGLVRDAQSLPFVLASLMADQDANRSSEAIARQLLASACPLQFDGQRLLELAEFHDDVLRHVYALTLKAVDELRMSSAQACLETLADIQGQLAALFPGDPVIGG